MIFFKRNYNCFYLLCLLITSCSNLVSDKTAEPGWPTMTMETKPWTRWWWHGSAVTKEGITAELEAYQKAGIGGVEITPIYGVYGREDQFINYLSPEWMELLIHTLKEGERLGMGVDMATGTGWPFGGPWVTTEDACKTIRYKIFEVKGGTTFNNKIEFIETPYLRLVNNQVYEVHDGAEEEGRTVQGTRKEPVLIARPKNITIKDLTEPIAENKNLQALAIDQVQFEKPLPLKLLMAYSDMGEAIDLTANVDPTGKVTWVAPAGDWKLYAIFQGWHGKMVERAGPGGEGNVIDHFAKKAVENYLHHFDSAFKNHNISSLRAFFNDSYEVDDARGNADFTPALFEEFLARRGYDLRNHLPALFNKSEEEKNTRVLCDYRETISELVLDNFTQTWKKWAHNYSAIVRNQAHGSPSNILDLYAVVDIPEIEGDEPLRFKMATSSGNVSGKKLVSAEAATWLNEHFESNLADIKEALDKFMLQGINHLVYHGTTYSPAEEPWPGRLFYAAVHANPRNPLWHDFEALNIYVTRCQSFLQQTKPDNEVLVYYPIYDRFSTPGTEMIEHFDGIGKQFAGTTFAQCAEEMQSKGYTFDFISDKQLQETSIEQTLLKTTGNSFYKTLILPHCKFIPLSTMEKIMRLAEEGATVISLNGLPESISGYHDIEKKKLRFNEIVQQLKQQNGGEVQIGKGRILFGNELDPLLEQSNIKREAIIDSGIQFIRKKADDGRTLYFVYNTNNTVYEGWLPFNIGANTPSVVLYDPINNKFGKANVRTSSSGGIDVFVQLTSKQSLILETHSADIKTASFPYINRAGDPIVIQGPWNITFDTGGPVLPQPVTSDTLLLWSDLKMDNYTSFSGTATYRLQFKKPNMDTKQWLFEIETVKETAEVILNGKPAGKMIGPVFQLVFDNALLQENNVLEIRVTNLMANRIAWMDRQGISWKKFYNINFPARKPENVKNNLFSAAHWQTKPSGITGTVTITPMK